MKTPKKAKCGIHTLSFCNNKHDAPQCTECILVKHRDRKYIYKDGQKYKRCPHCNQYKPLTEYDTNAQGYYGWCRECQREYARMYKRTDKKSFIVGYKNDNGVRKFIKVDTAAKMIKLVREHMVTNNEASLEIKRL